MCLFDKNIFDGQNRLPFIRPAKFENAVIQPPEPTNSFRPPPKIVRIMRTRAPDSAKERLQKNNAAIFWPQEKTVSRETRVRLMKKILRFT